MKTLEEINMRIAEIRSLAANASAEELTALEKELDQLTQERSALLGVAEQRTKLLSKIADGMGDIVPPIGGGVPGVAGGEQRNGANQNGETDPEQLLSSAEYRKAWLMFEQGRDITQAQRTMLTRAAGAVSSGDVNGAIPTQTSNKIIEMVRNFAPLLDKISLVHVKGFVKYLVAKPLDRATKHTENAQIDRTKPTMLTVTLQAYEIVKLVEISETVKTMTIDGFEAWLTRAIAKSIAEEISYLIKFGNGTDEATGIENGITWNEGKNLLTVASGATLTTSDVLTLCAMLPSTYDRNAEFLMSKKTLLTVFAPLVDKSKHSIVTNEGKQYYVNGDPVTLDDEIALGDAYYGDLTAYHGNMPQNVTMRTAYEIDTNSYKYSGVAMFDGKPAIPEAFVKLTKATT